MAARDLHPPLSLPSSHSTLFFYPPKSPPTTKPTLSNTTSFDPISSRWDRLPPPPPPLRPILRRHPSFLSRNLPIQSVTVSGNLVLLAATADNLLPALPRPLVFDPISQNWGFGPSLRTPRRWCTAGASGDTVFVASGIGSHYTTDAARSVERWDLRNNRRGKNGLELGGNWEKLGRDERWEIQCRSGMLAGWRGPAAAMDEGTLFAVDEAKGVLRRYDGASDRWEEVVAEVRLRGAERMAAAGGRVCVVCSGGVGGLWWWTWWRPRRDCGWWIRQRILKLWTFISCRG
ncbi:hypothetical protein Acr_11g0010320 [Actinidia rufa]|uniref:Galactose oxidase/kelch repeat superfamily protein n=1 Tax=Actinidia rufa TaxID=165716 RepID=A0A7J0FE63_9ERIC|nr:hypothetical protein Acr_11g0010320 [Actinidia rufa]